MTAEKFPSPDTSASFQPGGSFFPQPAPHTSQISAAPVAIPSPAYFGPSTVEGNNVSFPEPSPHPQMSFAQGHGLNQGYQGQTFTSETHTQTETKAHGPCCCPCTCFAGCCAAFCLIPCCVCC